MRRFSLFQRFPSSELARGFFVTLLGSGLSKVILMMATFVFAHLLSKDDFGAFSFVRNTLNTILCICALNYIGLVTKFTAEIEYNIKSIARIALLFLFSLAICVVIGGGLLLLPSKALAHVIGSSNLNLHFRIIGALLPFFMLQPLIEGVLRGLKHFKIIGTIQVVTAILFVLNVVVGSILYGLNGAITGLFVYYFIYALLSCYVIAKYTDIISYFKKITGSCLTTEVPVLFNMILPVFFLSFIEAPITWWAQTLLAKYDNMGAVGSMSALLQIRNLLIIVPNYYFSTFTTFQASLNASGNQQAYFTRFAKTMKILLPSATVATLVICAFGDFLLSLYGDNYRTDIVALYIALSAFPLLLLNSILRVNMLIKEHQKILLYTSIISSLLFIGTLYVMLPFVKSVEAYFYGQLVQCIAMCLIMIICYFYDKRSN